MTGVCNYTSFKGRMEFAPVAVAIDKMGSAKMAAGVITPDYPWLNKAILIAILAVILL